MRIESDLNSIYDAVAAAARTNLGSKLDAVVLYGSYARGDFDDESDIDIMIRVNCPREELNSYKPFFIKLASRLSLEYEIEVSLHLIDSYTFNRYRDHLPFYENIEREGIKIA